MNPLCIDIFCGLGGWSQGFLDAGYHCRGYDVEAHDYGSGGYPGELVLRDVRSIHGSEFKDAACIVASPPCQEYSYMAMPWSIAKQKAAAIRADATGAMRMHLTDLFNQCWRLQREACEAAGHYIPMVVENVRGAQPWVGRAKANYGSFYLWGDVGMVGNRVVAIVEGKVLGHGVAPVKALKNGTGGSWFPQGNGAVVVNNHGRDGDKNPAAGEKVPGFRFDGSGRSFQSAAVKTVGHANIRDGHGHTRHLTNQRESDAVKQPGHSGRAWFADPDVAGHFSSKSNSRKAASALIAKIPFALSSHIARAFKP